MAKFDLLVKGGFLVDPGGQKEGRFDVGLEGWLVAEVGSDLNPDLALNVFDAGGKLVFPGLVDSHVHLTPGRRAVGLQMLARAA